VPGPVLGLVACGGGVPHPPYVRQATTALARVDVGPPTGRVETIPPRPEGADAWVDGEWILRRGRWYWLLGRWVKVPQGAVYAPWVLVRAADGGAYYTPSVWRDVRSGATRAPPPGLAFATASGEAVLSPEGEPEQTGRALKSAP
jgi:hypothetical protein